MHVEEPIELRCAVMHELGELKEEDAYEEVQIETKWWFVALNAT